MGKLTHSQRLIGGDTWHRYLNGSKHKEQIEKDIARTLGGHCTACSFFSPSIAVHCLSPTDNHDATMSTSMDC